MVVIGGGCDRDGCDQGRRDRGAPARRRVRRAGGPDAPRHPRAAERRRRPGGLRAGGAARHVAARLHETPAGARERRPGCALEGGEGGELRALRRADEGGLRLDVALREVLDREARLARPLSLSARGATSMERSQQLKEKPFLALERSYPVGPEKVWRAWTDPQALKRWWGPGGEQGGKDQVSLVQLDVRAGGRFRIVFGGPQGNEHEVQGVYKEVVPPTFTATGKLVFTWTWPN